MDDLTKARARLVVKVYQERGDVRNAFIVLAQSLEPGLDYGISEAFALVKAAAREMGEDGSQVNGAALGI